MSQTLERVTFSTSRLLEFFSDKELQMQIGHSQSWWPVALLKELTDNALDACESSGVEPRIKVTVEGDAVSVRDNGPGLPVETLERSLDYTVRVSDKSHYVSPTRGQLGNALKCVWAAPFVTSGERGTVDVFTGGYKYRIDVTLDRIAQQPCLQVTTSPDGVVKTGTLVKMHWPGVAGYLRLINSCNFYYPPLSAPEMVKRYAAFNPHAAFCYSGPDDEWTIDASAPDWRKWAATDPTSPHWYTTERLCSLIAAYVADERNGGRQRTVREFVSEFRGLSSTAKQKRITEATGLSGAYLHDLAHDGGIAHAPTAALLEAMRTESREVKPAALGVIGEEHLTARWAQAYGYAKRAGVTDDGLPFVVEVAFGPNVSECGLEIVTGLNWAPALKIPFNALNHHLNEALVDYDDPVVVVVHLACPRLEFTDRGKATLALPDEISNALRLAVKNATKNWTSVKKRMKREEKASQREIEQMRQRQRRQRWTIKEAAYEVMEAAYMMASAGNTLPANARQIMYAARPSVLELTGDRCWKNSSYFTQKLLPDFVEANPDLTADWDVVYDARGRLVEPHTDCQVDLGTLEVRRYISDWTGGNLGYPSVNLDHMVGTCGPTNRYRYALFVEKEGFNELLKAARIAERYDLAIMSTKGMSVTAARKLVDRLSQKGVTILVVRDFDKSGFSIVHTLRSDSRRYRYTATPKVIDLGLRLADVQAMGLDSEPVRYRSNKDPSRRLHRCGATEAECDFLVQGSRGRGWYGERVELNAMTSDQFITWLEGKLAEVGVSKIVPDDAVLAKAYKRQKALADCQQAIDKILAENRKNEVTVPAGLRERVQKALDDNPLLAWDDALWEIVWTAKGKQAAGN